MRSSNFIGSYVLFVGIALTINEYYNLREILRSSYELKDYIKSLNTSPDVPALITNPRDSFNYGNQPLREVQNKNPHNHHARKSQAGLEMRVRTRIAKAEKAREEIMMQDAFGKKMKSNRWIKRHHNSRYTIQSESFPWVY
jgi:hypothetical protein